ncbi:MAG TPA: hypothetical protein VGQ36_03480 [Thermoanaerobaculia bacterium]|nr:hypothetical protein [Thermoanaerobaculia bacterium]
MSRVASELASIAQQNDDVLAQLQRPIWWLRASAAAALIALLAVSVWIIVWFARMADVRNLSLADLLQAVEAALNELIFLSLAAFFLASLEVRFKRRKALGMLHRFRSLAHIVDMHQLTKDPEYVLHSVARTASSPARPLTRAELTRYLEYSSELLALVSKLAALHAQDLVDAVVLEAVNDVESLTADLSRKVWQKITILNITAVSDEG